MISADRKRYSFSAAAYARLLINIGRDHIRLASDEEAGYRFNDTDYVLYTLESHFTAAEFGVDPVDTVDRALHEAGRADWWYQNEKQYDELGSYDSESEEDE